MLIDRNQVRQLLRDSDFETLWLEELGWDDHPQKLSVTVDESEYLLTAIAEKRGMAVFLCPASTDEGIPRLYYPDVKFNGRLPNLFAKTSLFIPMLRKPHRSGSGSNGNRGNPSHVVNIPIIVDSPVNP